MEHPMDMAKTGKGLLAGIVISAVVTAAMLLVLALLMYVTDMGSGSMKIGVYVIYIAAAMSGGWIAGRKIGFKKFLWGVLSGLIYYLLICVVSALSGGMTESGFTIQVTTVLMCLGGGMLGGMLA